MTIRRIRSMVGTVFGLSMLAVLPSWSELPKGLQILLSPGSPESAATPLPRAAAEPLDPHLLRSLLQRLPKIHPKPGDKQDFAMRERSLPAPRTGKVVSQAFPPPPGLASAPKVAAGPLQLLRHGPEGDVEMAPFVSVTFNQPMVPITSIDELDKIPVPIQIEPKPPGHWRWLGAQTAVFEPKGIRFPMASEYTVTVPAGTPSPAGKTLAQAEQWHFRTPTVTLTNSFPHNGPQVLRPLLYAAFNQDIDPAAVFATVKLSGQSRTFPLELVPREEALKDERLRGLLDDKRHLVMRPVEPLPKATSFSVEIGPGTPSLEGPRKTERVQSFSFETFHPLAVDDQDHNAEPGAPWWIRFNNPLDASHFDPTSIKVTPTLKDMRCSVSGNVLMIRGQSHGRTNYTVTLPATLADTFGQTLDKEQGVAIPVGSMQPSFRPPGQQFLILDPSGAPGFHCSVVNYKQLRVRAWAVGPQDWKVYQNYAQEWRRNPAGLVTPGRAVLDERISVGGGPDEEQDMVVGLKAALSQSHGQLVVQVDPQPEEANQWRRQSYVGWVQSTQVGLDAMIDGESMLVSTTRLTDGTPLPGVTVTQWADGKPGLSAVSGADGLARLPLKAGVEMIVAGSGETAILPREVSYWGQSSWIGVPRQDALQWDIIDDRQMYKPGEQVQIKGWVRQQQHAHRGDLVMSSTTGLTYRVTDSRGNEILKSNTKVGRLGSFNYAFALPKTVNLGNVNIAMTAEGASGVSGLQTNHSVQVQEFRRPEFEVSAKAEQASCLVGEHSTVDVDAHYYAGGGLPNADVQWSVTSAPTSYTPPNWSEFTFGSWTPWWSYDFWWRRPQPSAEAKSFTTHTDAAGKSSLRLDFPSVDPAQPYSVTAQATVQDVNRQAWSASSTVMVHPSAFYVGLKAKRAFVEKGKPIEMSTVVTDLDGKPVVGKTVKIVAYQNDWDWQNGELKVKRVHETSQNITSTGTPVDFSVQTVDGGVYQVEAAIADQQNRRNHSDMTVWVAGGKEPPKRNVEQEAVTLVPSQKTYRPGDVAEILVQVPFAPAQVIVSKRRYGLVETEKMTLATGSTTLKVPIEEGFTPNLFVQVDAVGSQPRTDADGTVVPGVAPRPAYATGSLDLSIPPDDRKLQVNVTPASAAVTPGARTSVGVTVKDAAGKPVSAEVTLLMVDESVLALTGYDPEDPLKLFYAERPSEVSDAHNRQFVELQLAKELQQDVRQREAEKDGVARGGIELDEAMPMAKAATTANFPGYSSLPVNSFSSRSGGLQKLKEASAPIALRTNFNPLALYLPSLQTDAEGHANVPVKMPDNLTRYRLIALVASGDKQFGKAEAALTARQPLMVRPSAPRFLNFGDHCELPVVVQNQTDQPMDVDVVCRATNAILSRPGVRVHVKANDRAEVRFACSTVKAGTARFQFAASSGAFADAAEVSLPVWTPATTEAFATYGTIDEGAISQPVRAPKHVYPQFGGLEVTTSSTAVAELTDAFVYLESYPFECAEQLSSRMLAAAALKDVLSAFKAPGLPDKATLEAAMQRDLARLKGQQNYDGGWDFWTRGVESNPYVSLHVAHALVRVKSKGFAVDEAMLAQSLNYVRTIESHIPANYSQSCKWSLRAYALYIQRLEGHPDAAKANALLREGGVKGLSVEAIGWILPSLTEGKAEVRRYLANQVVETAATAQFSSSYGDDGYLLLYSSRRTDGILLEALIEDQPKSDLIPKLVHGLLGHRVRGRWENTQENCFILLALDSYFNHYEKKTPDFLARLWLGSQYAGQQSFHGRSTDQKQLKIPMSQLHGDKNLILQKSGQGRLYYRIGMDYAPTNLNLASSDQGFTVERSYEATGDNRDVHRDPDGTWHIKAGAEVRVNLTMVAPARRYHVALVDPLPAGLEATNPALAVTGTRPSAPVSRGRGRGGWWWNPQWYEHQNLRDERVEAFTQLLWEGVYHYSYLARATTPGRFVVPPTKAEEMYHPETFGRSHSDKVDVE